MGSSSDAGSRWRLSGLNCKAVLGEVVTCDFSRVSLGAGSLVTSLASQCCSQHISAKTSNISCEFYGYGMRYGITCFGFKGLGL